MRCRLSSSAASAPRARLRRVSSSLTPTTPSSSQCHASCPWASTEVRRGLDGLLDLVALEAARADVRPRRLALQHDADALEVRVEAPLRGHHRVAPVVAEAGLLPADRADLGHGGGY